MHDHDGPRARPGHDVRVKGAGGYAGAVLGVDIPVDADVAQGVELRQGGGVPGTIGETEVGTWGVSSDPGDGATSEVTISS